MSMHLSDFALLAQAIRQSGATRDACKPIAQAIAQAIEASPSGGRKFDYHRFMAQALGPVEALRPGPLAPRDAQGIAHFPAGPKAKLFRAYDSPEAYGL